MYKMKLYLFFFFFKEKYTYIPHVCSVYCKRSHVYNSNWFVTNTPVYIRSVYQWYA